MRGALIGCGHIAAEQMRAWKKVTGAEIVAVCDIDHDKAKKLAALFEIESIYSDHRRMLDVERPDFVDIATRPESHLGLTQDAADHGCHVLCQKPMANSIEEAVSMVEYCARRGVRLMINENARHQPWYRHLKHMIESGCLGSVFYAMFHNHRCATLPEPQFDAQPYFAMMPRLLAFEMGVHHVDTAEFLFGEADDIYSRLRRISPHIVGDDNALIVMGFGPVTCVIDLSWCSVGIDQTPGKRLPWCRLTIEGTKATAALADDGSVTIYRRDGEPERFAFSEDSVFQGFVATQAHFIDALCNGSEFETSGKQTLKTMELIFAAYKRNACDFDSVRRFPS